MSDELRIILVLLALVTFWILLGMIGAPKASGAQNRSTFVYHGQYASNGAMVLTPMLAPNIGVEMIAGPVPKKGQVFNCEALNKKIGTMRVGKDLRAMQQMILSCGKTTFLVMGVVLR